MKNSCNSMFRHQPTRIFASLIALLVWSGARDHASAQAPATPTAPISIEVNAAQVLHTVPERYHGTNFVALWNKTGDSPGTVKAFSQMGARLLRFPGGVPCEYYDWEHPLASGFTVITPERAYNMAKAGDAWMIFQTNAFNKKDGINKKSQQPYSFDNSGKHAAGWVLNAKQAGMKVAFWEIGNEPEMDASSEAKKSQDTVYKVYNAKFEEQGRAIKAVDPTAMLMGPASTNNYFWWTLKNLEKFMKAQGNKGGTGLVDAVSLHWYPEGSMGSWEAKRGTAQGWVASMKYIQSVIKQYDSRPLPVYLTEWNWGGGQNNTGASKFSNALGCADCVGMFLRSGVSGHTHFCLQHIQNNWGVLATGGEPKPENEPSPSYFAMAIASQLFGSVLETKNSADEKNVLSAYATSSAPGTVSVMLINKTEKEQNVKVTFTGIRPATGKQWTLLPANGKIDDTDVIYNGQKSPSPTAGKLPEPVPVQVQADGQYAQKVMPYSLTVVTFAPRPGVPAPIQGLRPVTR